MLKKILLVLVAVVAGFAGVVAMQPASYTVARTIAIAAPADQVFALINDFHKWEAWSPWEKLDPAMKKTFGGAPTGASATYHWSGNDEVGEGRMTITASQANQRVTIKLDFLRPFPSTATNEFALNAEGSGVAVRWSMEGEHNFMSKGFCLVMGGMDKMIGPDFDKGLAQLKTVAEAGKK